MTARTRGRGHPGRLRLNTTHGPVSGGRGHRDSHAERAVSTPHALTAPLNRGSGCAPLYYESLFGWSLVTQIGWDHVPPTCLYPHGAEDFEMGVTAHCGVNDV